MGADRVVPAMSVVNFITAASGGVTPPSPGLNSLVDEMGDLAATPFLSGSPICISRDGSTVFAFGYNLSTPGVWVWRWNGTNWPNLQILTFSTSGDFTGWLIADQRRFLTIDCNDDG